MKDISGNEALEKVVGLLVAELVERAPQLFLRIDMHDTDCRGAGARLQQPRSGHIAEEAMDLFGVEDAGELRHGHAGIARTLPHGELVAEEAGRRLTHAGQAQVLASQSGGLKIEFVEGNDPVDAVLAHDAVDVAEYVVRRQVLGHRDEAGNRLARPVGVMELVHGKQCDLDAEVGGFAQKSLAFFVGADAKDGRSCIDHAISFCRFRDAGQM